MSARKVFTTNHVHKELEVMPMADRYELLVDDMFFDCGDAEEAERQAFYSFMEAYGDYDAFFGGSLIECVSTSELAFAG